MNSSGLNTDPWCSSTSTRNSHVCSISSYNCLSSLVHTLGHSTSLSGILLLQAPRRNLSWYYIVCFLQVYKTIRCGYILAFSLVSVSHRFFPWHKPKLHLTSHYIHSPDISGYVLIIWFPGIYYTLSPFSLYTGINSLFFQCSCISCISFRSQISRYKSGIRSMPSSIGALIISVATHISPHSRWWFLTHCPFKHRCVYFLRDAMF